MRDVTSPCKVKDCNNNQQCKEMCERHYRRVYGPHSPSLNDHCYLQRRRGLPVIDWDLIKHGCPRCGYKDLRWHTLSVWCLRCEWVRNWKKGGRVMPISEPQKPTDAAFVPPYIVPERYRITPFINRESLVLLELREIKTILRQIRDRL